MILLTLLGIIKYGVLKINDKKPSFPLLLQLSIDTEMRTIKK